MPYIERRFSRTKTLRDIICFTVGGEEIDQGRSYFFARLIDIGEGGARLETEQQCDMEDEIWLQGLDTLSDVIAGRVKWIKATGAKYNLGLMFNHH